MATGKSSVGPLVAQRARRPFIDLDARVAEKAGLSVAQIFATRGEAEFRRMEREELTRLLEAASDAAPVIALGGGTLLARDLRLWALDRAVVITLEASLAEIVRRAGTAGTRPLLAGSDPQAAALALLDQRKRAYAESHARVSTTDRSPAAAADEVLEIWQRDPIAVAAGEDSYTVEIAAQALDSRLSSLIGHPSRLVIVSDETVWRLHGARALAALGSDARPLLVELRPGEEHKHIGSVERIWRACLEGGLDRSARLLALGGGVVSDVAGFAAASYMRGIAWVGVPSTLLAMVDASVGGKTGVDLLRAKNAVGAFHQPKGVLCDVSLLNTEGQRGFRGALAEVVKSALIGDTDLLNLLESEPAQVAERSPELIAEVVRRSIRVKARIVGQDERESGLRAVLNLGHTVGHALEAQGGYSRLSHGEAVSLGLVAALRLGVALGTTPADLPPRIEALLRGLGLPTDLTAEPLREAVELIGHDKKRSGTQVRFVVARAPERVETVDLELQQLQRLVSGLV